MRKSKRKIEMKIVLKKSVKEVKVMEVSMEEEKPLGFKEKEGLSDPKNMKMEVRKKEFPIPDPISKGEKFITSHSGYSLKFAETVDSIRDFIEEKQIFTMRDLVDYLIDEGYDVDTIDIERYVSDCIKDGELAKGKDNNYMVV